MRLCKLGPKKRPLVERLRPKARFRGTFRLQVRRRFVGAPEFPRHGTVFFTPSRDIFRADLIWSRAMDFYSRVAIFGHTRRFG